MAAKINLKRDLDEMIFQQLAQLKQGFKKEGFSPAERINIHVEPAPLPKMQPFSSPDSRFKWIFASQHGDLKGVLKYAIDCALKGNHEIYRELADLYAQGMPRLQLGRDLALSEAWRALSHEPNNRHALNRLGHHYLSKPDMQEISLLLLTHIATRFDDYAAYYHLGQLHSLPTRASTGNHREAVKCLERCVTLTGNFETERDPAIQKQKRAFFSKALSSLALCHRQMGNPQLEYRVLYALYCTQGKSRAPHIAQFWEHLGDCEQALGWYKSYFVAISPEGMTLDWWRAADKIASLIPNQNSAEKGLWQALSESRASSPKTAGLIAGYLFFMGITVKQDVPQAERFLQVVLDDLPKREKGEAHALLGVIEKIKYERRHERNQANIAMRHFSEGARHKAPLAMRAIIEMHEKGQLYEYGVTMRDLSQAYFHLASFFASQKPYDFFSSLQGNEIPSNVALAAHYLQNAAQFKSEFKELARTLINGDYPNAISAFVLEHMIDEWRAGCQESQNIAKEIYQKCKPPVSKSKEAFLRENFSSRAEPHPKSNDESMIQRFFMQAAESNWDEKRFERRLARFIERFFATDVEMISQINIEADKHRLQMMEKGIWKRVEESFEPKGLLSPDERAQLEQLRIHLETGLGISITDKKSLKKAIAAYAFKWHEDRHGKKEAPPIPIGNVMEWVNGYIELMKRQDPSWK